jgi:hypothetical protein
MEGAEIPGRSRNTWREQKYREEVGIHGLTRNTWKVFLVNPCIPTSSKYSWLIHVFLLLHCISAPSNVFLLLPGISAPSMYSYFFQVFLVNYGGSRNTGKHKKYTEGTEIQGRSRNTLR